MITYELAKELKDAGFPQGESGDYINPKGDVEYSGYWTEDNRDDYVYIPTLSELIGACGEGFLELIRMSDEDMVNYSWEAGTDGYRMVGNTPEEAVARLWLALRVK